MDYINRYAEEEGVKPSKALVKKIHREIDLPSLVKVLLLIVRKEVTIKGLEREYDAIFLNQEEVQNKTYKT